MKPRALALAALFFLVPWAAFAHVGSPDVFYEGPVGPYPVDITIHMPPVVPGQAQILVRMKNSDPVKVSFLPIYSTTAVKNAPPADPGHLVGGETNLYSGQLWLMTFGAYGIEVRIDGKAGPGSIQIPVNSVATSQLPLPPYLEKLLLFLGALLVIGGLGIVEASVREAMLPPGAVPAARDRRRGMVACGIAVVIIAFLLAGGNWWWDSEAMNFRRHLLSGGWPDMAANVQVRGSQRILHLTIGGKAFAPDYSLPLLLDHGKLLHFFLVREPGRDVFAHIHPVRTGGKTFDVALPPLPEGRYEGFCDMTFAQGLSTTGTMAVQLPAMPAAQSTAAAMVPDPDDSWAAGPAATAPAAPNADTVYQLPDGSRVAWKAHAALRVKQDAALRFQVRDAAGHPAALEPYMGMISHVAVLRDDGAVFTHLHPTGNYSMAAQMYFMQKMSSETGTAKGDGMAGMAGMPGMMDMNHPGPPDALISIPYEFPSAGNYRIWVQFKTGGKIWTAVFDADVAA